MMNAKQPDQVYLACGATDLRRSIDGLVALVKMRFRLDPFSNCLFAFCNQMSLFNEAEQEADARVAEPDIEEITYKRKKRVDQKDEMLPNLPVETVDYYLPEEEQFCSECGEHLHIMGRDIRRELIGSKALAGKSYCDKLFSIEKKLAECSPADRYTKRLEQAKPVLDVFFAWLKSLEVLPKTALVKAVQYTLNQWEYLENYLHDGRCELSNNRAERSIKPFVIGRKNFLFSDTARGAKASAIVYSIIETAKENGLNPMSYLTYLFGKMPNLDFKGNPDIFGILFPWGSLPEACYMKKSG